MGVKDFNKVIQKAEVKPVEIEKQDYRFIIYDFSNLLVISIFSNFSKLQSSEEDSVRTFTIGKYRAEIKGETNLVLHDVKEQLELLIDGCVSRLKETVDLCFTKFKTLEKIYMITDPPYEYDYTFQVGERGQINACDLELFNKWIEINEIEPDENGLIHFNSKKEEREKRSKQMAIVHPIQIYDEETDELLLETTDYTIFDHPESLVEREIRKVVNSIIDSIDPPANREIDCEIMNLNLNELKDKDSNLSLMFRFLKQSLYFISKRHLLNLVPVIHNQFIERMKKTDLDVVVLESKGEADPCIKAFYESNIYGERTLVISADTDYWFLFGEVEDVDVVSPMESLNNARNPFEFWSRLFKSSAPTFLRLCLARSSALLGNDYTQKLGIVNPEDFSADIVRLFNIGNDEYTQIKPGRRRNLSRVTRTMTDQKIVLPIGEKLSPKDILMRSFKLIDLSIMKQMDDPKVKTSRSFFNGYYETLLIYMNFYLYGEVSNLTEKPHDLTSIEEHFKTYERTTIDNENGLINFED